MYFRKWIIISGNYSGNRLLLGNGFFISQLDCFSGKQVLSKDTLLMYRNNLLILKNAHKRIAFTYGLNENLINPFLEHKKTGFGTAYIKTWPEIRAFTWFL